MSNFKDGKDRSASKAGKLRQYGGSQLDFAGTHDPLSKSSLSPKRRPKIERETGPDTEDGPIVKSIKGMYFEWNPHEDLDDAYLIFDAKGPRLTLIFSGREMHISKSDIRWMVIYFYSRHRGIHTILRKRTI
jgi:hypothetical protein